MSTRTADGRIIRVTGPVVDVEFPPGDLPEINHALTFERESAGRTGNGCQRIPESRSSQNGARSLAFWILPVPVRGSSSTKSNERGRL